MRRCVWTRNLANEEAKARYRAVKIQPPWVVTAGKQTNNNPPYWRRFLHPQTEDAPCCGDRVPVTMVLYHDTELDRRHFTDCCDLVVFSSGQQNVNIIVRSPVLWAWILQLRFVKIKNENSFILEGQTWRRLNVDMSKLVTSLVVYIFNTRRKLLYVHVTMHRNKFVTFMWPCIVTSLSRSCDRAS